MQVTTLGAGDPRVVVAGAVHGDEPCGARAIERFLAEDHDVQRPVKFIVLNEPALAENVRYIDTDVNRTLPGDPMSDLYERRLAYDFINEIVGCVGLGLHSTVSYDRPFGSNANPNERKRGLFTSLSLLDNVVDFTPVTRGNRCVDLPQFVDLEAGEQWSDQAAENAYNCMMDFLKFTGVLDDEVKRTETTEYRVFDFYRKEEEHNYHFLAENFELVEEGEIYASQNGENVIAEQDFYPVLFSDEGHENLFGYHASLIK